MTLLPPEVWRSLQYAPGNIKSTILPLNIISCDEVGPSVYFKPKTSVKYSRVRHMLGKVNEVTEMALAWVRNSNINSCLYSIIQKSLNRSRVPKHSQNTIEWEFCSWAWKRINLLWNLCRWAWKRVDLSSVRDGEQRELCV